MGSDLGYMSVVESVADVDNTFLSRREITCNFTGLAGRLRKVEAVEMVAKKFNLDGKVVIPIRLKTQIGKPTITGVFHVYDDEKLAKRYINPKILARFEKAKAGKPEASE